MVDALLCLQLDVMFLFSFISLSLAWMLRPRMIWRTLSFAYYSCRIDINDAGLHLSLRDYRLPPHRTTYYLLSPTTSHTILPSTRPII